MIHILIVHDNPLVGLGLHSTLECHPDLCVIGKITEYEQLMDRTEATRPDVVVLDGALSSCLPAYSAVDLVAHLRRAGAGAVFVLAPSRDEETLFRFLVSGAAAYELPTISPDDLVEKVRQVAHGEYLISSTVLRKPEQRPAPPPVSVPVRRRSAPGELSAREIVVLRHIMRGRSNKQIAIAMQISDQTVKNHITSILKKFGVRDRTRAVVVGFIQGVLSLPKVNAKTVVSENGQPALQPSSLAFSLESYARVVNQ